MAERLRFKVTEMAKALSRDYIEFTKGAPKDYQHAIVHPARGHILSAYHLVRAANGCLLYDPNRRKLQERAYEELERFDDLLPILESYGANVLSIKAKNQLQKQLVELCDKMLNWMASDTSQMKEMLRQKRRKVGYELHKTKEDYDKIKRFYLLLPEEEKVSGMSILAAAFDEATAKLQVKKVDYDAVNENYRRIIVKEEADKERAAILKGKKVFEQTIIERVVAEIDAAKNMSLAEIPESLKELPKKDDPKEVRKQKYTDKKEMKEVAHRKKAEKRYEKLYTEKDGLPTVYDENGRKVKNPLTREVTPVITSDNTEHKG